MEPRKLKKLAGGGEEDADGRTSDEVERLLSPEVAYMELRGGAGGFSCGTCVFAGPGEHCVHPDIDAPVSAERGCCNLWAGDGVTFPPNYKKPKVG